MKKVLLHLFSNEETKAQVRLCSIQGHRAQSRSGIIILFILLSVSFIKLQIINFLLNSNAKRSYFPQHKSYLTICSFVLPSMILINMEPQGPSSGRIYKHNININIYI